MNDALAAEFCGEAVWLTPERALWHGGSSSLFVADLHLGKEGSFQAKGLPIPNGPSDATLARLAAVVARFSPERLVVLGDLFHDADGLRAAGGSLAAWRAQHRLPVTLVGGSHDRWAGELPAQLGIEAVQEPWACGPFLCRHYPEAIPGGCVLAGHLHPGVAIRDSRRTSERLPCFVLERGLAVLPAFGEFTGLATVTPSRKDRVFAVLPDRVVEIPM